MRHEIERSIIQHASACFGVRFAVDCGPFFLANVRCRTKPQKPNVLLILADNVGYGDMGPYGGGELRGYPTPRIDQLAREGCGSPSIWLAKPHRPGQHSLEYRLQISTRTVDYLEQLCCCGLPL
jgi:hypothetical protein